METTKFLVTRTSCWDSYVRKSSGKELVKPFNKDLDIEGYEPEKLDYSLKKEEFSWSGTTYKGWFIEIQKQKIPDFKQDIGEDVIITTFHDTETKVLEIYDDYRE